MCMLCVITCAPMLSSLACGPMPGAARGGFMSMLRVVGSEGSGPAGESTRVPGVWESIASFPCKSLCGYQVASGTAKAPRCSQLGPTNPCPVLSWTFQSHSGIRGHREDVCSSRSQPHRHCVPQDNLPLTQTGHGMAQGSVPRPRAPATTGPLGHWGLSGTQAAWLQGEALPSADLYRTGGGEPKSTDPKPHEWPNDH